MVALAPAVTPEPPAVIEPEKTPAMPAEVRTKAPWPPVRLTADGGLPEGREGARQRDFDDRAGGHVDRRAAGERLVDRDALGVEGDRERAGGDRQVARQVGEDGIRARGAAAELPGHPGRGDDDRAGHSVGGGDVDKRRAGGAELE